MLPGLPERNPGLELANAFSVTDQEFPHSLYREVVLTSWDWHMSDYAGKTLDQRAIE
jgi:hypothetical protein